MVVLKYFIYFLASDDDEDDDDAKTKVSPEKGKLVKPIEVSNWVTALCTFDNLSIQL